MVGRPTHVCLIVCVTAISRNSAKHLQTYLSAARFAFQFLFVPLKIDLVPTLPKRFEDVPANPVSMILSFS